MKHDTPQVLFVDDDERVLHYVNRSLSSDGFDVVTTQDWGRARDLLRRAEVNPDIIFIEPLSESSDMELREICHEVHETPVVVLSTARHPEYIVDAIVAGARDYLCKPFEPKMLSQKIGKILSADGEASSSSVAKAKPQETQLIFSSARMKQIHETVQQVADIKVPVLLQGESGVGKDVVARTIHQVSKLSNRPFVKVNCAAMPAELVESELFGYRKGAFTGAHTDRPGKFEFANSGTIFLDEIGEFTSSIQAKLLQVLQDGTFTRLGNNRETAIDVRVIAATNRKLEEAIKDGSFREDLYYRLNVVNIEVPPLRERREEIPLLCEHFLNKLAPLYNSTVHELPPTLEKLFCTYHWPGNVRELENLIKRYLVLQDADSIQGELESKMSSGVMDRINEVTQNYLQEAGEELNLKEISKRAAGVAEKSMITKTLRKTHWNKWKAAKELQVSYKTLLTKIERHKIAPPQ